MQAQKKMVSYKAGNVDRAIHFVFMILLDLVIAVSKAIHMFRFGQIDPSQFNDQLKEMYNWSNVAERTEKVCRCIDR